MRVRVSARVYFISLSLCSVLPRVPLPSFLRSFLPSLFLWLLHLLRVLAVRTLVTSSLMFNGPFLAKEERGTWNEGRDERESGAEGTRNRAGQPERSFLAG